MKILAVHSTSLFLGVAVCEKLQVLASRVIPPSKKHLENLAPLIRTVMEDLKLRIGDLSGLGVAIGPGSFSGIRIGLSTMKGIALARNLPIMPVSSLEILASGGLTQGESGFAVIDAKRHQFYIQGFHKDENRLHETSEPALKGVAEISDVLQKEGTNIVVGESIPDIINSPAVIFREIGHSPDICAKLAYLKFRHGVTQNIDSIEPLYIRRSDAEEKAAKLS